MMRYEVKTQLTPEAALQRAIGYFGPQGIGLEITDQNQACLIFQGGGGHVAVTACPGKEPKEKTRVELETREWDYAVRKFMAEVHA
jgi:hypothetical protein